MYVTEGIGVPNNRIVQKNFRLIIQNHSTLIIDIFKVINKGVGQLQMDQIVD